MKNLMRAPVSETYQAIVAAPSFCLGLRGDDCELHSLVYLEPGPEVPPRNPLAAEAARQLRAYLIDPGFIFELPLRPSGTAFQRRVWEQIIAIPSRQTKSYGELARILHNAPRAVGQACGANPFPLIVPCHRVIATGGGLGGFARQRGGFLLDVKRWLLAHEGH
ncbi:methylated-DNA--[protein]-cysteine S-methyltransferase [Propionivibrio sp.]|uniref:methylated-DNA--[protein]-cysteine S-methyltransferase n=1 Tax=Propionivibrio sp. TaxID=2212460 RepID=UPI00262EB84D|nr:methylated-DNA--[protein]-cysteine S-methyltransferase [Propionivibrio sp.]